MSLVMLILILLLLGLCWWATDNFIPIPNPLNWLIKLVIAVTAIVLVLKAFGVLDVLMGVSVPHLH